MVRGDWMHPGEPADRGPAVVEVDSEFPFRLHPGRCLAETLVAAEAEYADDETTHATIAAVMAATGIAGVATDVAEVFPLESVVESAAVVLAVVATERAARGLPDLP